MKKLLAIILCMTMLLGGCTTPKEEIDTSSDAVETNTEEKIPISEFYKTVTDSKRPIAIMIDNDSEASRPQIGLENAYLLYEIIVEGGASRIMALFKNYELEKVGPVRSSRHYFLDYALENGAVYTHAGWSPQAQRDISALGVNNINGIMGGDGVNFWRDNTYDRTYHNLYTSTAKLADYAENTKKYMMRANNGPVEFAKIDSDAGDIECTGVSFRYSDMYGVSYSYNTETGLYERAINGKAHVSQTGEVLSAKNIIIYDVANYTLNDGQNKGRQDLKNVGSGEGWYISMGKAQKINWSKSARTEKTVYTTTDGEVLKVNPGITYIQIIPKGNAVNMEPKAN